MERADGRYGFILSRAELRTRGLRIAGRRLTKAHFDLLICGMNYDMGTSRNDD